MKKHFHIKTLAILFSIAMVFGTVFTPGLTVQADEMPVEVDVETEAEAKAEAIPAAGVEANTEMETAASQVENPENTADGIAEETDVGTEEQGDDAVEEPTPEPAIESVSGEAETSEGEVTTEPEAEIPDVEVQVSDEVISDNKESAEEETASDAVEGNVVETAEEAPVLEVSEETEAEGEGIEEQIPEDGGTIAVEASNVSNTDIVSYAMQFQGYPYSSNGTGPSSFSSLGFINYVFSHFGIAREEQAYMLYMNPGIFGTCPSESEALPGDLVVWDGHQGIYTGNGKCICAMQSTGVSVINVSSYVNANGTLNPRHIYIRRNEVTYPSTPTSYSITYSSLSTDFIDEYNVAPRGVINNPSGAVVDQVRCRIYTSGGTLVADHVESCGLSNNPINQYHNAWGDFSASEWKNGIGHLSPSTSYYFIMSAHASDGWHDSNAYYFSTPAATPQNNDPKGSVDSVWASNGYIHISGWAFDPDTPGEDVWLHVYVGGAAGTGAKSYHYQTNREHRPDVETAYGSVGAYHGYSLQIPVTERGSQEVHVYAINTGGGNNPEIGSGTVTIAENYFDVNFTLDGKNITSSEGIATFDVEFLNKNVYWHVKGEDCTDYYAYPDYTESPSAGATAGIFDMKTNTGYKLSRVTSNSSSLSGSGSVMPYTVKLDVSPVTEIVLHFSTVRVTSVGLNKSALTLAKGSTEKLTAKLTPSDALNQKVTWSSSNISIATVDSNGLVTAKNPGTAVITVKTDDGGYTAACTVTVPAATVAVTGVSLNKTSLSLKKGAAEKLTAMVAPSNAANKAVTWSSSNTSIATVASDGTVKGVAKGSATITVKTADGGKTAACTVTVTDNGTTPVDPQPSGNKTTGWYLENGNYFWYENGVKQGTKGRGKEIYFSGAAGINNPGNFPAGWYWLDAIQGGARAVSKDVYQESKAGQWADRADGTGKWVRYDANGQMIKGWQTTNGKTYYFDLTYGTMAKGYATIDGTEYYFNPSNGVLNKTLGSVPKNGWKRVDGKDYWYENWQRQGVSNAKGYRGKEIYFSGKSGIANPNGLPAGWYWLDNVYAGAKAANKEVYMPYTINGKDNIGKWVRYDATGQMIKGWYETGGNMYYYDPVTGAMTKGTKVINGVTYRFDLKTGILLSD